MPKLQNPIQMAAIGAPHGIKGEVRVKTFTGDPLALGDYGPLFASDGRRFDIVDIRPAKNVVVVRFKQVTNRDQAEALNGEALFVDRAALPDDLEENEFYHTDLIGLDAVDPNGERLGKVIAFHDFGGGDIMEVALAGKRTVLVPFTSTAVPAVDLAAGRLTVDPVAAGMEGDEGDGPGMPPSGGSPSGFDAGQRPRGPRSAGGNR